MIDSIYKCEKTNKFTIYDSGCGCCSEYYDLASKEFSVQDLEDHKKQLVAQLEVIDEAIDKRKWIDKEN